MKNEIQCNIVSDLLPLYVDGLTSENTNTFIQKHLEECSDCQKEYQTFQIELGSSKNSSDATVTREVNYLKKIKTYQNINLVLGAIISFLFGMCLPVLRVGIPVILGGAIPEYYLARLQMAWHIGLLKMLVSGICVCISYLFIMFLVRRKVRNK